MNDETLDLFSYFEKEGKEEQEKEEKNPPSSEKKTSPPSEKEVPSEKPAGGMVPLEVPSTEKKMGVKKKTSRSSQKEEPSLSSDEPLLDPEEKGPPVLTISQLTHQIRNTLEGQFARVWVCGEITNLSRPKSGHFYFSLKDDQAQISAVIWRTLAKTLTFNLEDGMEVLVLGRITVYPGRGNYQIIPEKIEPKGIGALQLAFEQMKKKLELEGLFDPARKRPIPSLPHRIGIVTSPSGAAIRDMLKIIYGRLPYVSVLIYPTKVQGEGAAIEIAEGIRVLNTIEDIDVIIIGRGGGSLEDLWAFNEEVVARAIFNSRLPIISAVGHEVDISISDLVADLRAPTPTAAGETVVPKYDMLIRDLEDQKERILRALQNVVSFHKARLDGLKNSYVFRRPEEMVLNLERKTDEMVERLFRPLPEIMERWRERLSDKKDRLFQGVQKDLIFFKERLRAIAGTLDALSPLKILERGYSITLDQKDIPLKKLEDLAPGDMVTTLLKDGKILSRIEEIQIQERKKENGNPKK